MRSFITSPIAARTSIRAKEGSRVADADRFAMGESDPAPSDQPRGGRRPGHIVVSPRRFDRSARTPRRRKDDVTRQVSWLAALTRPIRLPKTHLHASQWHFGSGARRLQLRGQPRNKVKQHPHRVPFFHPPSPKLRLIDTGYTDSTTLESKVRQVGLVLNREGVTFRLQDVRLLPRSTVQGKATAARGSRSHAFAL